MTGELFTIDVKRKYLTTEEQGRFIAAANTHKRAEARTFCQTLACTGCRISEALELTPEHIDLSDKSITFRTLNQRDKVKYRSVPCPDTPLDAIDLVHSVRKARRSTKLKKMALWSWGRTQATTWVSKPKELPPRLLAEPGVSVSTHRAPIVPTAVSPRPFQ